MTAVRQSQQCFKMFWLPSCHAHQFARKLCKNFKVYAAAGQAFILTQCLLQAQGTHCPQSCHLLPLTAACFFYPSRSNALLPKTTLRNIQNFTKTPKCSENDC